MPEHTLTMDDGSTVTGSWQDLSLHRASSGVRWVHGLVTCETCRRSWWTHAGAEEIRCAACAGNEEEASG